MVELTRTRPTSLPKRDSLNWSRLLRAEVMSSMLLKKLVMLRSTGSGVTYLYPLAAGLRKALSKSVLNRNMALL